MVKQNSSSWTSPAQLGQSFNDDDDGVKYFREKFLEDSISCEWHVV